MISSQSVELISLRFHTGPFWHEGTKCLQAFFLSMSHQKGQSSHQYFVKKTSKNKASMNRKCHSHIPQTNLQQIKKGS